MAWLRNPGGQQGSATPPSAQHRQPFPDPTAPKAEPERVVQKPAEPPKATRPIVDPVTGALMSIQPDAAEASIKAGGVDYRPRTKRRKRTS